MYLTRITRQYADITVTATLADGSPATIAGVDVALLKNGATPTGATTWTPATWTAPVAQVLLAGPDADPTGAIAVSAGGDLWMRVVDSPEVTAAKVVSVRIV